MVVTGMEARRGSVRQVKQHEALDIPGFLIRDPSKYRLNELPEDYDLDKFIADWPK